MGRPTGLEPAKRYAAEQWLDVLRSRVQPVANGAALELPFLPAALPDRNQDMVLLLADLASAAADPAWLPLLRTWQAAETRRVRARLAPIIATLNQSPPVTDRP